MAAKNRARENAQDGVCVVQIDWSVPPLPPLVGPFSKRTKAEDWARQNISDGEWNVAPLASKATASAWAGVR